MITAHTNTLTDLAKDIEAELPKLEEEIRQLRAAFHIAAGTRPGQAQDRYMRQTIQELQSTIAMSNGLLFRTTEVYKKINQSTEACGVGGQNTQHHENIKAKSQKPKARQAV